VRQAISQALPTWLGVPLDVSFGYATFPADGETPRGLLGVADERMYSDKFSRRSGLPIPPTASEREAPASAARLSSGGATLVSAG